MDQVDKQKLMVIAKKNTKVNSDALTIRRIDVPLAIHVEVDSVSGGLRSPSREAWGGSVIGIVSGIVEARPCIINTGNFGGRELKRCQRRRQ